MKYFGEYTEGMPEFDYRNLNESIATEDKWLASLPGPVIKFQVADGYALYLYKDNGLYHLPLGDGYQVMGALIRGLTKREVEAMVEREKNLAALFNKGT